MEHCKNCQAELEEGVKVCPQCGMEQTAGESAAEQEITPETAPEPETAGAGETAASLETPEVKMTPGITLTLTPGKIALAVVGLIVLVALLVALIVWGMSGSKEDPIQMSSPTENVEEQITETTVPPTVPEDGDPNNETCKGTYTASDEDVLAAKDTVIATAGDHELTLGMLQLYYWQEVRSFLNQYGSYAMYFGLDYTQSLDTQPCGIMEGRTWQQYFLLSAINSWRTYTALDAAAAEAGYTMEAEYAEELENLPQNMEQQAAENGFQNAQEMIEFNVGVGTDVEAYAAFMEVYYHGYSYFNDCYKNFTATDEEIEQMFLDHEQEYAQNGLTKEIQTVDVRHILIYPEGADSSTIRTETFPEEAWTAGEARAQEILDTWRAGEATEESFAALAGEHSGDLGSASTGGLYEGVKQGDMVEAFDAWCFDPQRQVGDSDIVRTEFGFHIMFYSGGEIIENPDWKGLVKEDVLNQKANDLVDTHVEKNPLTVQWDKVLLCFVDLSQ